ncbi:hypothetical protein C8R43DRAFT_1241289 [Mycena crocata]|nr:hypothetical protein C8R43DRAFT_1241289 [Mycena crocata]
MRADAQRQGPNRLPFHLPHLTKEQYDALTIDDGQLGRVTLRRGLHVPAKRVFVGRVHPDVIGILIDIASSDDILLVLLAANNVLRSQEPDLITAQIQLFLAVIGQCFGTEDTTEAFDSWLLWAYPLFEHALRVFVTVVPAPSVPRLRLRSSLFIPNLARWTRPGRTREPLIKTCRSPRHAEELVVACLAL